MMNSQQTAKTVELLADSSARILLTAQRRITDAFAACEIVSAGTMQGLMEAQAKAHLADQLQTRWNRGGMKAIEEWLGDAAERLIEQTVGGTSSLVQNAMEAAERKALQSCYRELNRCRA